MQENNVCIIKPLSTVCDLKKARLQKEVRPSIRSFASRVGKLTKIQEDRWKALWPSYGLNREASFDLKNVLGDLRNVFGREAPKILEIGFGQGMSLAEMAENQNEADFIGIEVYRTGILRLLETANKKALRNIKVFWGDARELILKISDQDLDRIQVFFPDPWPKNRHHKRRLINAAMIELFSQKLKSGGLLHLATDWQDYAAQMMKIVSLNDHFKNTAGAQQFSQRPSIRPLTKYENRGKRLGHTIFDLIFEKI